MTTATDPFAQAAEALSGASTVALACHVNPDADALGSMLGLSNYLRERGKNTECSFPNDPFDPPRWVELLPGHDALVHPKTFPKQPAVLVTCDVASMDRLAMLGAVAGLASREGVEVVGMEAAAVSYPGFTADLAALTS